MPACIHCGAQCDAPPVHSEEAERASRHAGAGARVGGCRGADPDRRLGLVLVPGPRPGSGPFRNEARTDAPAVTRPAPAPLPVLKARDDLTGLTTPQELGDSGETWAHDLQARGLALCVLHVGLDGLEPVIERYGQDAGNQVLQQVARRLRQLARDEDRVMRFDGNEFVLLLACPGSESRSFAQSMAARIRSELQRPLAYRTLSKLEIGCSVGAAIWPLHGDTLEAVIRYAADALAAARSRPMPQASTTSSQAAAA